MKRARDVAVEAHRRALWQVLGIYLVAAWIGYQVILAITDGVGLPDWVPAVAIVLFIIGLPIVLATAFVHEGAPSAVRFEADPTLLPDVHVARVQRVRAVLTWRRALLGGALAFAALGLSAGSYMGLRSAGIGPFGSLVAANAMLPREPVLLTAFAATDTALADLVTEALRVDLEQSTSVALVPAARVAESLVRMRRPATARVDEALGNELAEREGIAVLVTGEVTSAANRLLITARLQKVPSGDVLASFRESSRRANDVLDAVDRLSRSIRARVGESLTSVRKTPRLAAVTTSSLDALRLYFRSLTLPTDDAVPLLEEAVRLDNTFAMAYRQLSGRYVEQRRFQLANEAAAAAYRHRDRLTERERLMTIGTYHARRWERELAATAYTTLLEKWPDDNWAAINLATVYRDLGDYPNAAKYYEIGVKLDTLNGNYHPSLVAVYWRLGDTTAARRHLETWKQRRPDARHALLGHEVNWALASDNYVAADSIAHVRLDSATTPQQRENALDNLRDVALFQGRAADASALSRERREVALARGEPQAAIGSLADEASFRITHGLPADELRRQVEAMIAQHWSSIAPLDRPWGPVAELYRHAGDDAGVQRLRFESREVPPERLGKLADLSYFTAGVHLARGRYAEALAELREARARCRESCLSDAFGDAFFGLEQADSALHYYAEYIGQRSFSSPYYESLHRARVLERLAQLHDARGDVEQAVRSYAALLRQWERADPVFQPRINAARERLTRLRAGRG